jgi:hypothetical protein
MLTRTASCVIGAALSVIMPLISLALLWFGVGFEIAVGPVNLTAILWPSSRWILVGWRITPLGMVTTVGAIVANLFLYVGIAWLLHFGVVNLGRHRRVSRLGQ